MKKLLILSFLFTIIMSYAQTNPGDNTLDPYIDKFVGTWKWENGNNSLTLFMKKENVSWSIVGGEFNFDTIIGFHKLIQNGIVIEDNLAFSHTNFKDKKKSILANSDENNHNILFGGIIHKSKNKGVDMTIQYIDSTHIKIISIKNPPGTKLKPYDKTISLPQDVILTRQ